MPTSAATGGIVVGGHDPESAQAHRRGDRLCGEARGPFRCTRARGHRQAQHVAWSAESGVALAVWARAESSTMAAVREAAQVYARAQAARQAALVELQDAIREAHAEGQHTVNDIIAASGLSRQTVYDAIKPKTSQRRDETE